MEWKKKVVDASCLSRRWGMLLSVLVASLFAFPSSDYAGIVKTPPKVVAGVVQEVTTGHIEVEGVYYDISQAKIVTTDGGKATSSSIRKGSHVVIVLEEGTVTKVRINNNEKSVVK
ncbi:MAG TPA: hypothetical protein VFG09_07980 [Thermodesulfovibrionales bacterium]|nr:hypothetical protein [Thermodesulfovibrionales bacterium]